MRSSSNSNSNCNNLVASNSTSENFMDDTKDRFQIGPPPTAPTHPVFSLAYNDHIFNAPKNRPIDDKKLPYRARVHREEHLVEDEVLAMICNGHGHLLLPNTGRSVPIFEHNICVHSHEEHDHGGHFLVWEWHGHVVMYDREHGYSPEYIHGYYLQDLSGNSSDVGVDAYFDEEEEQQQEKEKVEVENSGLRELIDGNDSSGSRILHRNMNPGSPRS